MRAQPRMCQAGQSPAHTLTHRGSHNSQPGAGRLRAEHGAQGGGRRHHPQLAESASPGTRAAGPLPAPRQCPTRYPYCAFTGNGSTRFNTAAFRQVALAVEVRVPQPHRLTGHSALQSARTPGVGGHRQCPRVPQTGRSPPATAPGAQGGPGAALGPASRAAPAYLCPERGWRCSCRSR